MSRDDCVVRLRRQGTAALVGLSIVTFGLYAVYYIVQQTAVLNDYLTERMRISRGLLTAVVVLGVVTACIAIPSLMLDDDHPAQLPFSLLNMAHAVLTIVWGFMAKNRMNVMLGASPHESRWFGGVGTFLFTPFYFNYKINVLNDFGAHAPMVAPAYAIAIKQRPTRTKPVWRDFAGGGEAEQFVTREAVSLLDSREQIERAAYVLDETSLGRAPRHCFAVLTDRRLFLIRVRTEGETGDRPYSEYPVLESAGLEEYSLPKRTSFGAPKHGQHHIARIDAASGDDDTISFVLENGRELGLRKVTIGWMSAQDEFFAEVPRRFPGGAES